MQKTILGVVAALVVVGGGWYFYMQKGEFALASSSVKQDTSLIVTESMLGKWQSVDDAKYVREFKEKDAVVDWYDGKTVSTGLWVVFTKEKAPKVFPYTMDTSSVYLQLTMTGSQADTLNFKISKMTLEELQLVYLDRGGVLTFKRVQ